MKNSPVYQTQTVVTATPARLGGETGRILKGVIFYCLADGTAVFKNGLTDTGDTLLTLGGLAKTTVVVDLTPYGGISFSTGTFCTLTGTGNIAYCWFE